MKVISLHHHGEPADVLTVDERRVPEPREGEVWVRILTTPVNPFDLGAGQRTGQLDDYSSIVAAGWSLSGFVAA
jgi:NADPH:quinone reductase-like Zn-dependent oxidoreductase